MYVTQVWAIQFEYPVTVQPMFYQGFQAGACPFSSRKRCRDGMTSDDYEVATRKKSLEKTSPDEVGRRFFQ